MLKCQQGHIHSVPQVVILVQVFTIPQPVLLLVKQDTHSWLAIVPALLTAQVISLEFFQLTHVISVTPAALPVTMLVLVGV
jgi:hypothetical protein